MTSGNWKYKQHFEMYDRVGSRTQYARCKLCESWDQTEGEALGTEDVMAHKVRLEEPIRRHLTKQRRQKEQEEEQEKEHI
jgi:hypothetical protein